MACAPLSELLAGTLEALAARQGWQLPERLRLVLEPPRDECHGDFASNLALTLAKPLRQAPGTIAQAIAASLPPTGLLEQVDVAGAGFLNFHLRTDWLLARLTDLLENGPAALVPRLGGHYEGVLSLPDAPLSASAARLAVLASGMQSLLRATGSEGAIACDPQPPPALLSRLGIRCETAPAAAVRSVLFHLKTWDRTVDNHDSHLDARDLPVRLLRDAQPFAGRPDLAALVEELGADIWRYGFLAGPAQGPLELDLGQLRRETAENPLYALQYTHARTAAIERLASEQGLAGAPLPLTASSPLSPEERKLLLTLATYPDDVAFAAEQLDPSRIVRLAHGISARFQRFQSEHRVLLEAENSQLLGLALVIGTRKSLDHALVTLLGVSAPNAL